nr:hypothetical protein [Escherichia coli]
MCEIRLRKREKREKKRERRKARGKPEMWLRGTAGVGLALSIPHFA